MKYYIYLMRHAHIDTKNCMIGKNNLPLSILGISQANYWREQLKDIIFEKVYVSPLSRAMQSAEIILESKNIQAVKIDEFSEISLGNWEGKSKAEIKQHDSLLWKQRGEDFFNFPPPHGESFSDLSKRVLPKFNTLCEELKTQNKSTEAFEKFEEVRNIFIVAHQAVNRIILADILGLDKSKLREIPQEYACINILELDENIQFIQILDCPIQ